MLKDISITAVLAGILAALIAYCGPLLIIFQVAQLAGVSNDTLMSWVWGTSFGIGITTLFLSYKFRIPVMTGWSVPGTVLLLSLFPAFSLGVYALTVFIKPNHVQLC